MDGEVQNEVKKKIDKKVKITLALTWIAYLPMAYFLFALSGMAGDSPYTPKSQVLISILLINGIPLLAMLTILYFAIKRNSILIALSPIILPSLFQAIIPLVARLF